jgi:hypothetical protein
MRTAAQGGGEVLGFATQASRAAVSPLAGLISTSPLIEQATPASKFLRWAGGIISNLAPHLHIPARTPPEVRVIYFASKTLEHELLTGSLTRPRIQ